MNGQRFESVTLARLSDSDKAAFYSRSGRAPDECRFRRATFEANHYVRALYVAPADRLSIRTYRLAE